MNAAHLNPTRKITKNDIHGRAYPLTEIKIAKPISKIENVDKRIQIINMVIRYLDVEYSKRYESINDKTFCNIYVYDVAYLLGCYIPRVWWKDEFTSSISSQGIAPIYGENVREVNSNMVFDWLAQFGNQFNWEKVEDFNKLKSQLINGTIGLICYKDDSGKGHISVAFVYDRKFLWPRKRKIMLSEAGLKNRQFFYEEWWKGKNSISFWHLKITN